MAQFIDQSSILHELNIQKDIRNTELYNNYLFNTNGFVNQREVSVYTSGSSPANNDDQFTLDMWNLISDGNDVLDVSYDSTEDAIKWDVETSKRAGFVQFIEQKNCRHLQDQTVQISCRVKSANISAIRMALLSWTSTADSPTTDVVSSWADTPTWAANYTAENTPADLTVTSSWTTVRVTGINIDTSGMNNLAFVIWLPNEETIGDIIYIKDVQLATGTSPKIFTPRSIETELALCKRYLQRYDSGSPDNSLIYSFGMVGDHSDHVLFIVYFIPEMRAVTSFSWSGGTSIRLTGGSGNVNISTLNAQTNTSNEKIGGLIATAASSVNIGDVYMLQANGSTTAFIEFNAEF